MARVNLLQTPRSRRLLIPARANELALIGLVLVIWTAVGVAIAILLGWHPLAR
jgi:hypothetical protein